MWCLCLTFFTFGLLLLRAEAVDECTGLPEDSDVRASFNSLLINQGGEGGVALTIRSGPFYTCQAQGSTMGTYRQVSVVLTYTRDAAPNDVIARQFELDCNEISNNLIWADRSGSLSTPDNSFDYMNSMRTDCASCVTNSPPNDNHCQPCDSACNSGLMRCTSDSSSDCCVAFDNGVCSDDLNCTETNFVANEQNNYTCACGVTCASGFEFNSTACSCILTDTCLANSPCTNGVCALGSTPDQYTCNCTGTDFMGTNCSVPVPFSSSSSSSSSIVPVTSTSSLSPSPTNVLVCSLNGCATCGSTNCCSQCSAGYKGDDCVCVSIPTPIICNVRDCATCSSSDSDCCSECKDGFSTGRDDPCSCVEIGTSTSQRSTVSATPTATVRPPRKSQGVNSSTLAGIAVSIVIGVLMLIVLIALVGYIIYYYIAGAAVAAAHKAKRSTPFANGEAHDNPLYLNPEEVDQL